MSGFEVAAALEPDEMPVIIFVNVHPQHALRAFEVTEFENLLQAD